MPHLRVGYPLKTGFSSLISCSIDVDYTAEGKQEERKRGMEKFDPTLYAIG
jgi:hypothetical protein